ncbi:MAG: hypothetical protein IJ480_00065 [Clostridia bacterium]|nr:hypothetical protein [Clostridia bacterium]
MSIADILFRHHTSPVIYIKVYPCVSCTIHKKPERLSISMEKRSGRVLGYPAKGCTQPIAA